jgi:hypothetical protein
MKLRYYIGMRGKNQVFAEKTLPAGKNVPQTRRSRPEQLKAFASALTLCSAGVINRDGGFSGSKA